MKVGDFGLARDVYSTDYYRAHQGARIPVKWMAPETLTDAISNEKTDVVSLRKHFILHCYRAITILVVIWSDLLGGVFSGTRSVSRNTEPRHTQVHLHRQEKIRKTITVS